MAENERASVADAETVEGVAAVADDPAPNKSDAAVDDRSVLERLECIEAAQGELRGGMERLASAVTPLLTQQFRDMESKVRAYEQRLRLRQERPLIMKMSGLLSDIRRLNSDVDVREHVDEAIERLLLDLGYQPFGAEGESYDPQFHEAIGGRVAETTVVVKVHTSGLACFGDVVVKSRVEVGPPSEPADEHSNQRWEP